MSRQPAERLFTNKELLVIVVFFSLYARVLLQLDPEWVMWLGFTTLGTLPPEQLPPPIFGDAREAFHVASGLSIIGLLGILLLLVVEGEVQCPWQSWLRSRWRRVWFQIVFGGRKSPTVGMEASLWNPDRRG
jgi:hypothetical protein